MAETVNEIEAHIDRTREELGSNLRELEDRVAAATDWREHYRTRPHLFLGAAFAAGVVLAIAVRTRSGRFDFDAAPRAPRRALNGTHPIKSQALELWDNVQGALMGVASARIKDYISDLVPGFDDHYRRAEQHATGFDSTRSSAGRVTSG